MSVLTLHGEEDDDDDERKRWCNICTVICIRNRDRRPSVRWSTVWNALAKTLQKTKRRSFPALQPEFHG